MESVFRECSIEEWFFYLKKIESSAISSTPTLDDNIFSSMQWIDDEIEKCKKQKAFCLRDGDGKSICWASIYYLSPNVLRLRGLYVLPAYRNNGYMTNLLRNIFKIYKGRAYKVLSFSAPRSIGFHEKFGFEKVEEFSQRPVSYNGSLDKEEILLYCYKLA